VLQNTCNKQNANVSEGKKIYLKTSSICADYYVTHTYEWFCESPYVFKELQETHVDFYDFPMQMLNWSARRYTIFYIFSDVSIFTDLRVYVFPCVSQLARSSGVTATPRSRIMRY